MTMPSNIHQLVYGFKMEHVEAAAGGDVTVKAGRGLVAGIRTGAGLVNPIQLKDGSTEVWQLPPDTRDLFGVPVVFDTSIVISFPAAGECWLIYS